MINKNASSYDQSMTMWHNVNPWQYCRTRDNFNIFQWYLYCMWERNDMNNACRTTRHKTTDSGLWRARPLPKAEKDNSKSMNTTEARTMNEWITAEARNSKNNRYLNYSKFFRSECKRHIETPKCREYRASGNSRSRYSANTRPRF